MIFQRKLRKISTTGSANQCLNWIYSQASVLYFKNLYSYFAWQLTIWHQLFSKIMPTKSNFKLKKWFQLSWLMNYVSMLHFPWESGTELCLPCASLRNIINNIYCKRIVDIKSGLVNSHACPWLEKMRKFFDPSLTCKMSENWLSNICTNPEYSRFYVNRWVLNVSNKHSTLSA